jgi:threonine/homoserine/homoserine lactone efflux protein
MGRIEEVSSHDSANSLRKGVLTNLLNPHPYVFWITVGVPFILKAWATGPWGAALWLLIFYLMLVGSKIGLSILVGHTKRWIQSSVYIWLNRILGLLLLFFAVGLARDGIVLITR